MPVFHIKYGYIKLFILYCLVGVGEPTHSAHDAENIVVGSVDGNAGSVLSPDGVVAEHKLERGIVDARHIARSARLVLLRAQGERVNVDTRVRRARVMLVRLHGIEVRSFALTETVLSVKLELGSHNRVLPPAVQVEGGLREHEGASVRHKAFGVVLARAERRARRWVPPISVRDRRPRVHGRGAGRHCTRVDEEPAHDEFARRGGARTREGVVSVRERVNAVRVVPRLHPERLVELLTRLELLAAVDEVVLLDGENKLLARVVEIELDLVARGSNRLVASELKLLNEVLVRVLRHAAALVGVKEDVVDVERGGDERLGVGTLRGLVARARPVPVGRVRGIHAPAERVDSPQEAVKSVQLNVNLHLVILEGNKRKRETRVAAEPELERHVKRGLRKRAARHARVARGASVARDVDGRERWVRQVSELRGLPDHLVVAALLFGGHRKLIPQVHELPVLTVNALPSNLNLHVINHVDTRVIDPAGKGGVTSRTLRLGWVAGVDLREHHLKVGAVGKIAIARDGALHTAAEVSLPIESLFNRFHGEISVSAVGNFPECDLRVPSQVNVLGSVSDKLH